MSVIKGCEGKLFKLKGVVLGQREVTIQEAKEEEKPQKDNRSPSKGKPNKSGDKPTKKVGGKNDFKRGDKKGKSNKPKNKSPHTQSNKSRLTQMFEDELNSAQKKARKF